MKEAQHTPGPWKSTISEGRGDLCIVTDETWICGELHNPNGDMDIAEARANARLIAAAPDMLAALKAADERLTTMASMTEGRADDEWVWEAQGKVKAAIAKAEGRA